MITGVGNKLSQETFFAAFGSSAHAVASA